MAVKINRGSALALLDLTPMIDVVFNLLIFFMVVSQFASEERSLKVELPMGSEAMPLTARPKEIFINIDTQGRYYMGARRLDEPELAQYLRQAAADNPLTQTVVIRADRRVQWDFVATAMRLCNEAGIRDYSASLSAAGP
ncbi:MAG: biopolymer transporter ExbD [Pirellulaceae bacterium]